MPKLSSTALSTTQPNFSQTGTTLTPRLSSTLGPTPLSARRNLERFSPIKYDDPKYEERFREAGINLRTRPIKQTSFMGFGESTF
jgi:hypothetical protein